MGQPAVSPLESFDFDAVALDGADGRPRSPQVSSQVASLHRDLMDTLDEGQRSNIHVELGMIALKDGRLEAGARHFREALLLDPRSQAARRWLDDLGEGAAAVRPERPRGLRGLFARLKG